MGPLAALCVLWTHFQHHFGHTIYVRIAVANIRGNAPRARFAGRSDHCARDRERGNGYADRRLTDSGRRLVLALIDRFHRSVLATVAARVTISNPGVKS